MSEPAPIPIIDAHQLVKQYTDGTHALRGATFSIHSGEFVAIMGPSGSGKSTLLHILGFLDPQTSGVYRFRGNTVDDMTPRELSRVRNEEMGFVFQQFNLLPRATVLENVYLPLYYSIAPMRTWNERAEQAIASVGLLHRRFHLAYTLSGGEKQRVAIARALITTPNLIFADEPTGNLDSVAGKGVMDILTTLHREGHTVVLITHDESVAQRAERIITIRDGALVSDTSTL